MFPNWPAWTRTSHTLLPFYFCFHLRETSRHIFRKILSRRAVWNRFARLEASGIDKQGVNVLWYVRVFLLAGTYISIPMADTSKEFSLSQKKSWFRYLRTHRIAEKEFSSGEDRSHVPLSLTPKPQILNKSSLCLRTYTTRNAYTNTCAVHSNARER